jgi:hypothetical protein
LENGWLIEHRTTPREITDLLGVADRDLADAEVPRLSPDWRLNIAYNAALQSAAAALAAAGYRAARDGHHYRVIQSLTHTVGADAHVISQLDLFRKKRNIGGYERAGVTSDMEAGEMLTLARNLRKEVERWLGTNHPRLLRK